MSYPEILTELHNKHKKKKNGDAISLIDLRRAIAIMQKKHSNCRWRSEKIRKNFYYIQYEGVLWLKDVYFSNYDEKFTDKDIVWFKQRIQWYQEQFKKKNINYEEFNLKYSDMTKSEAAIFLNRTTRSIEIAVCEYEKSHTYTREYDEKGELKIHSSVIGWLVKNKYKQEYLSQLEKYKMYLTEIYKKHGGYYDNYFGRN